MRTLPARCLALSALSLFIGTGFAAEPYQPVSLICLGDAEGAAFAYEYPIASHTNSNGEVVISDEVGQISSSPYSATISVSRNVNLHSSGNTVTFSLTQPSVSSPGEVTVGAHPEKEMILEVSGSWELGKSFRIDGYALGAQKKPIEITCNLFEEGSNLRNLRSYAHPIVR